MAAGLLAFAAYFVLKWTGNFLYAEHPQPYQFVADFYRLLVEGLNFLFSGLMAFSPTPYGNLNTILRLATFGSLLAGIWYVTRVVTMRFDRTPGWAFTLLLAVFSAPGLVGFGCWLVVGVCHWLFRQTA